MTFSASRAMRARDEVNWRHASSLNWRLADPALWLQLSSAITHSSSDSTATITSRSPASESPASNSCMLWISCERSRTRSVSLARRSLMESYWALTRTFRAARARVGLAPRSARRASTGATKAEAERALMGAIYARGAMTHTTYQVAR